LQANKNPTEAPNSDESTSGVSTAMSTSDVVGVVVGAELGAVSGEPFPAGTVPFDGIESSPGSVDAWSSSGLVASTCPIGSNPLADAVPFPALWAVGRGGFVDEL
jgi:hypothetical protein